MLPDLPCYLNGEFVALTEAKISVMDRGFVFGDGVYEVIPLYKGKPFCFEEHMLRLQRSLKEVRIASPLSNEAYLSVVHRLSAQLAAQQKQALSDFDQLVYIQVTRGVALRDHAMVEGLEPTLFIMINAMKPPSALERSQGVACITAKDFRWEKAHIKSISLLGSVFAKQMSVDANVAETIMFRNGYLSEAAASNVWIVHNKKVMGPLKDHGVLEGIRYSLIEHLCQKMKIAFELRAISQQAFAQADEVFLSSATKEILPVTQIDGQAVASGRPGLITEQLYQAYQALKAA